MRPAGGFVRKGGLCALLIGIPGTLRCGMQLAMDLWGERAPPRPKDGANEDSRSKLEVFVWLGPFAGVLRGFGLLAGAPLIEFTLVRFSSRENWHSALLAGAGTFVVLYGVFALVLEHPLFEKLCGWGIPMRRWGMTALIRSS